MINEKFDKVLNESRADIRLTLTYVLHIIMLAVSLIGISLLAIMIITMKWDPDPKDYSGFLALFSFFNAITFSTFTIIVFVVVRAVMINTVQNYSTRISSPGTDLESLYADMAKKLMRFKNAGIIILFVSFLFSTFINLAIMSTPYTQVHPLYLLNGITMVLFPLFICINYPNIRNLKRTIRKCF